MRSDIYTEKHEIADILADVEKIGQFYSLASSDAAKLRLLAEEMLGMTVRLFDRLKYEFYVENEGKNFTLNLKAQTIVSGEQKEKMLSLSSSGENKAAKGVFGKISSVFEGLLFMDGAEYDPIYIPQYNDMGFVSYFSLSAYQDEMPKPIKKDRWDELEKSIIANFAKDVVIGVRNNKVETIVTIEF